MATAWIPGRRRSERAALAVAGAGLAAWLAFAALNPGAPAGAGAEGSAAAGAAAAGTPAPGGGPDPGSAAAAPRTDVGAALDGLRQRLADAPAPQPAARNPFTLGPAPVAAPAASGAAAAPRAAAAPAPAPPAGSDLALIGIATAGAGTDPAHTGILALPGGGVVLVGVGDQVAGGFRVEAVTPAGITLVDRSGARRRLALP